MHSNIRSGRVFGEYDGRDIFDEVMVIARPGVIVNLCQSAGESNLQPNVRSVWIAPTEDGTRVDNFENSVCVEAASQSAYSNSSYYLD